MSGGKEFFANGGLTHIHTSLSKDGFYTIEQVGLYTRQFLKSQYFAVADHLTSPYKGKIYSEEESWVRVNPMLREVEIYNERCQGPACVSGVEVNIKPDGLDIPDRVLSKVDYVVASRHFPWGEESPQVFERNIIAAMKNPHVDVIGHISRYAPGGVDWRKLLMVAGSTKTIIEVNFDSMPDDELLDMLAACQLPIALGIDFHSFANLLKNGDDATRIEAESFRGPEFSLVKSGVLIARHLRQHGILPQQAINLLGYSQFISLLRKAKHERTT